MRFVTLDFLQVIPPEGDKDTNATALYGENTIVVTFSILHYFILFYFFSIVVYG